MKIHITDETFSRDRKSAQSRAWPCRACRRKPCMDWSYTGGTWDYEIECCAAVYAVSLKRYRSNAHAFSILIAVWNVNNLPNAYVERYL